MITGKGKVKKVTIRAKVIRANGKVEDYGVIARSGWFWALIGRIKKWLRF